MEVWDWLRAVAALVATVALIGLLGLGARRFGFARASGFGGPKRMAVRERLILDARRQLVIVAVDGEEHLLLISPFGDSRLAGLPPRPAGDGEGP